MLLINKDFTGFSYKSPKIRFVQVVRTCHRYRLLSAFFALLFRSRVRSKYEEQRAKLKRCHCEESRQSRPWRDDDEAIPVGRDHL